MRIKVNDEILDIFDGAKVKDVVRIYYAQQNKQLSDKMPIVRDAYGHKVSEDGAVLTNSVLTIEKAEKTSKPKCQIAKKV